MKRLQWGMVGGGEGSQIGPAHRMASALDGLYDFVAGALDHRPDVGRAFGQRLGLEPSRSYGDWREMLERERERADRLDLVTVATPNATHYEICLAFLEAGFHVLCEKPLALNLASCDALVEAARRKGRICAVNYGYSGYPLVRQMRAMVAKGDLGAVRLVKAEFSHGHHADATATDHPRIGWRYDPLQSGLSAQFADCGIHALHLATFVCNRKLLCLSADPVATVTGRQLEDDVTVNFRLEGGTVGRLWTSAVAIGRQHGLTLQVFGERGGVAWSQEHPNQLYWTPLNGHRQILERGADGLSEEAQRGCRMTVGHVEGLPLAFANLYSDLAHTLRPNTPDLERKGNRDLCPRAEDGRDSVAAVLAVVFSGRAQGAWIDLASVKDPPDPSAEMPEAAT